MLKIKKAEDFGLGFNCMTRLYMNGYDEEILDDMVKVCDEYLKWFSQRTIVCSLRDLVRDYPFGWNEAEIPENQKERCERLIKDLTKQGICKEKKTSHIKDERIIIMSFGDDAGFINSIFGQSRNCTRDTFCQWVVDNKLNKEVDIKEVKADETIPIKKRFLPLFYKVCNYMIRYSYGRHTYMPSTSRDFVKTNMELMSDEALENIVVYLQERNANIPENEPTFYKIDSNNWIYMQEDIEAELLTRKMFYLAQEKGQNLKELRKMLNSLMDFALLHTQKDCLNLYYQVSGVEQYLIGLTKEEANVQRLLKQLEKGKKVIVEKRWEFFEKEEGDKYEKIGDGEYRRKK